MNQLVTTFIGRTLVAVYTALVIPLLPAWINFMNDTLGYDLTEAQVNAYATKASYGIAALATIWLVNRGLLERAVAFGKQILDDGDDTVAKNAK